MSATGTYSVSNVVKAEEGTCNKMAVRDGRLTMMIYVARSLTGVIPTIYILLNSTTTPKRLVEYNQSVRSTSFYL